MFDKISGYHGLAKFTYVINHYTPPGPAMKTSQAWQGCEARWAGGCLGPSLCRPGKELRLARHVGLYLRGQVHAEALCSFSDPRPGGKGHLDPNNVGFLCSRESGSHSRATPGQSMRSLVRQEPAKGWCWGCSSPLSR